VSELKYRCGMEAVLDLLGGKWKILILYHLYGTQLRFSDLRRLVGKISEKVLSQQLKEMVADGLLRRIDFKTVPPHVEYELTTFGLELCGTLKAICDWGSANMNEIIAIADARAIRLGKVNLD
jgi:DNA-binding HxlR family transcriptional regulator